MIGFSRARARNALLHGFLKAETFVEVNRIPKIFFKALPRPGFLDRNGAFRRRVAKHHFALATPCYASAVPSPASGSRCLAPARLSTAAAVPRGALPLLDCALPVPLSAAPWLCGPQPSRCFALPARYPASPSLGITSLRPARAPPCSANAALSVAVPFRAVLCRCITLQRLCCAGRCPRGALDCLCAPTRCLSCA